MAETRTGGGGNPAFGYRLVFDIGASKRVGSLKAVIESDSGRRIYNYNGQLCENSTGFVNGSDFINALHQKISYFSELVKGMHQNLFDSAADKEKLSGVAVYVPGITDKKNIIAYLPNLRDINNQSLRNINLTSYINRLKNNETDINVNKKKFKFAVTKDLGGTGLALAKILKQKGQLKPGQHYTIILTGGGFGSVDIKVKNDKSIEIITNEASNYIAPNHDITRQVEEILSHINDSQTVESLKKSLNVYSKIGRQGTGVKDYINVYFKSLGHKELAPLAIEAGDAKIVNYNTLSVRNNPELLAKLSDNEFFIKISEDDGAVQFALDSTKIKPELMKKAKIDATKAYATGIAEFSINKINDMVNEIIITGPLANGINDYIRQHRKFVGAKNLSDLIEKTINTIIDKNHADLPTTKELSSMRGGVKIRCSHDYDIKDNTYAGDIILENGVEFTRNRGNWLQVPINKI